MAELSIDNDPARVDALFNDADAVSFPGWNAHPLYGDFGQALGAAVNAERGAYTACPFAVVDGDEVLLLAGATAGSGSISGFGQPLALGLRAELGKKRRKRAFALAFDHLRALAAEHGADTIRILGADSGSALGETDLACLDQQARPEAHIHGIVDATQTEAEIHSALRDSYRSLVNWGRRQLHLQYVNADNPDRDLFDQYPAFHARIAGGSKYGAAYWDVFWREITAGRGELGLGFIEDGQLVTGTLTIDAGSTTYYTSGVYEREMFDKPLGHFPVFDAILRAGERGTRVFDLGEIFPAGAAEEKEVQIGFFKKGFTSTFQLRTHWLVDASAS